MAKGVIYIMATIVPSLIKIGKAETDNFERRMYTLENRGYLKRRFAIEVENCDEKETLLYEQAPNARDFSHEIQAPFFRMQKTEDFLILYNTGRERRCQDYAYAQTEA